MIMKKLLQSVWATFVRPQTNTLAGLFLAGFSLCATYQSSAQSLSYFFKDDQSGYCIAPLPGTTDFIAGGTIYDASTGNNRMQLVHCDNIGYYPLTETFDFDDPNSDDRLVKVIPLTSKLFAVVSYQQDLISITPRGRVRVIIMDIYWNIVTQALYDVNSNTSFQSLYPLDAIYDAPNKRFVVCGTAVKGTAFKKGSSKNAFAMSIDYSLGTPNVLNFNTMQYYGSTGPYEIANKVIPITLPTGASGYYLTGSETVDKGVGKVMGIRNMTIDGTTLGQVTSVPLYLSNNPKTSDNSVDMIPAKGKFGFAYNILVNYEELDSWGIIRVDPNTLLPYLDFESNPFPGVAYEFLQSNGASDQAVVASMLDPNNANAEPFHAYVDFSSFPSVVFQELEYPTVIGNNNGTISFWKMGDFYAEDNTYPLPSFLHKFSARQDPGYNTDYVVVAPIMESTNTWLNCKFMYADVNGKNPSCPFNGNSYGLNWSYTVKQDLPRQWTLQSAKDIGSAINISKYHYNNYDKCTGGYYKLSDNSAGTPVDSRSLVYPNPSQGLINVNLSGYGSDKVTVNLFDLTGKLIATIYEGTAKESISYQLPSGIAKGLYTLSIEASGKDKRMEKISIQ